MQMEAWDFSQLELVTRNLKEAWFFAFFSSDNLDIWMNVGNCYSFPDEREYLPSIAIVLSRPRFVGIMLLTYIYSNSCGRPEDIEP